MSPASPGARADTASLFRPMARAQSALRGAMQAAAHAAALQAASAGDFLGLNAWWQARHDAAHRFWFSAWADEGRRIGGEELEAGECAALEDLVYVVRGGGLRPHAALLTPLLAALSRYCHLAGPGGVAGLCAWLDRQADDLIAERERAAAHEAWAARAADAWPCAASRAAAEQAAFDLFGIPLHLLDGLGFVAAVFPPGPRARTLVPWDEAQRWRAKSARAVARESAPTGADPVAAAFVLGPDCAILIEAAGPRLFGASLVGADGQPADRTDFSSWSDAAPRLTSDLAIWARAAAARAVRRHMTDPATHAATILPTPPRLIYVAPGQEQVAIELALDAGATAIETPSDPFDDWASLPGRLSMAAEAMGARLEIRAPRAQPAQGAAA